MTRRTTQEQPYMHAESQIPSRQSNYTFSRICKHLGCRKSFVAMKRWQVFCCPECRHQYWKDIREKASRMAAEEDV